MKSNVISRMDDYQTIPHCCVLGVKTIVKNNGKILVLKRSNAGVRPGGWDFCGGLVELGEDPETAATREVKEESGLEITQLNIIGTYSKSSALSDGQLKHTVILGYIAEARTDDVKISEEHLDFQWLTKEEVENLELPEVHRKFLNLSK